MSYLLNDVTRKFLFRQAHAHSIWSNQPAEDDALPQPSDPMIHGRRVPTIATREFSFWPLAGSGKSAADSGPGNGTVNFTAREYRPRPAAGGFAGPAWTAQR